MASAKSKLKDYFESYVGEDIDRATLRDVAGGISDWPRALWILDTERIPKICVLNY